MKRISKRMILLLVLMGVLVAGVCFFVVRYFIQADEWVIFPGSPHVYVDGNLSSGKVTDAEGNLLLDATSGREYAQDPQLREATMHILGDRFGYISAPVLQAFGDELVGFNKITGLHDADAEPNVAQLTIYGSVQKQAQAALAGRKGTIGVYNYETGQILCAVTSPTYDPDAMPDVEGDTTGAYDGVYLNRFFQTTYVPGSIYKIVTTAAALEEIEGIEERTFYCEGEYAIGAYSVICNGTHYTQTLSQALANSCNVAFAQLALELGEDTLQSYAKKLGIISSVKVDGVETAPGKIELANAADVQIAWSGIGQHTDLVNACQYMTLMGQIAAGGEAAMPYIVEEVSGTYHARRKTASVPLSAQTCATLAQYMRQNVTTIYGQWNFPDLYVCAKSGTAELEDAEPHATFSGFIQDSNYPLAFIVIVEHGGSGSATCAPIAGQVLSACCAAMDAQRG